MTSQNPIASGQNQDSAELFLRGSRRSLILVFFLILVLGTTVLSLSLWPESGLAQWPSRLPWLLPVAIVIALAVQRSWLRGQRWDPDSPVVKAIMGDEFRRANMNRARLVAFTVILIAQVPIALLLTELPTLRALMAMAGATITLGMTTLIATFLFLDRE